MPQSHFDEHVAIAETLRTVEPTYWFIRMSLRVTDSNTEVQRRERTCKRPPRKTMIKTWMAFVPQRQKIPCFLVFCFSHSKSTVLSLMAQQKARHCRCCVRASGKWNFQPPKVSWLGRNYNFYASFLPFPAGNVTQLPVHSSALAGVLRYQVDVNRVFMVLQLKCVWSNWLWKHEKQNRIATVGIAQFTEDMTDNRFCWLREADGHWRGMTLEPWLSQAFLACGKAEKKADFRSYFIP